MKRARRKSGESNSPRLEDSDISRSADTYGATEITGQSQEKSGDSNSHTPGLEDSDISMSAEVYGPADITGQSQEKSGDSNSYSPGLDDSDIIESVDSISRDGPTLPYM